MGSCCPRSARGETHRPTPARRDPVLFVIGVTFGYSSCCRRVAVLPELQQRRVQCPRAGQPVLQICRDDPAGDGHGLPGARRDPRCDARRDRHSQATAPQPRYAILACAAVAAFLPGDAVTLILETVTAVHPLRDQHSGSVARWRDATRSGGGQRLWGWKSSVVVHRIRVRRRVRRPRRGRSWSASRVLLCGHGRRAGASVKQIIDHIDRELS